MRKLTGIILSLFLLCSTFAPSLAFAAENFDSNKIGWVQEGNEKYYFDKPGVKHTGWLELEGKNYYIDSSGKSLFSYQIINGKTHYLDDSGTARTGWMDTVDDKFYLSTNGEIKTGPLTYKGKEFHFNKYGEMDRGWIILQSFIKRVYPKPETKFIVESKRVKDGEVLEVIEKYGMWYKVKYQGEVGYVRTTDSLIFDQKAPNSIELSRNKALFTHSFLNLYQKNQELVFPPNQLKNLKEAINLYSELFSKGADFIFKIESMTKLDNKRGWVQENNNWYYYNKDGTHVTGFQIIDDKKYYFDTNGAMHKGWLEDENTRYYFSESGMMQKGLQQISGKYYYFNEAGQLSVGYQTIDGKPYYIEGSGEMTAGWIKKDYEWYFSHPTGALQTGDFTYKDKGFYFNQKGEMERGWITLESLVKKVYPEPDLKRVLRAQNVKGGEVIEVTGKYGSWYVVNYQGQKGYVRIHDAIIFDQEKKKPLVSLIEKGTVLKFLVEYNKSDQTFVADTLKAIEDSGHTAEDFNTFTTEVSDNIQAELPKIKATAKELKKSAQELKQQLLAGGITITDAVAEEILNTWDATNDILTQLYNNEHKKMEYLKTTMPRVQTDWDALTDAYFRYKYKIDYKQTAQEIKVIKQDAEKFQSSLHQLKTELVPLVQQTKEFKTQVYKNYEKIQQLAPGIYADANAGLDSVSNLMDSANRIASHKVDIPAAAHNIGNIDLTNNLRDLGVPPERYNKFIEEQKATNKLMSTTLDIYPGINVAKEAIQMYQGKELGTDRKYEPSDYAFGVLNVTSGGVTKTLGKVVGTVGDLEKKAKNLEKAAKNVSNSGFAVAEFDKKIAKMNVNEKIALIKSTSVDIAKQNSWKKDSKLTRINNRDVYFDSNTKNYYALDTQHGRFEVVNKKGKHQGEVDFNLNSTKPADKSGGHDLKMS